jgi:hypothetical protein
MISTPFIKEKKYDPADPKVLDLLFSLAILKYNGNMEINPLITNYFNE